MEVFPSGAGLSGWSLGDLDFTPADPAGLDATPGRGIVVSGRALLTGGIAQRAARAGQAPSN